MTARKRQERERHRHVNKDRQKQRDRERERERDNMHKMKVTGKICNQTTVSSAINLIGNCYKFCANFCIKIVFVFF